MSYELSYEREHGPDRTVPSKSIRKARVEAAEHDEDIRYALNRTSTASQAVADLEGTR